MGPLKFVFGLRILAGILQVYINIIRYPVVGI